MATITLDVHNSKHELSSLFRDEDGDDSDSRLIEKQVDHVPKPVEDGHIDKNQTHGDT